MDTSIPSIGDVLMLSQISWRVGRAFTSGRKSAPREFIQIEAELNGLAKALKVLAEALFSDSVEAMLKQAENQTHFGIATIVLSCKRTLEDLESLVDQYQVIKKNPTAGGYSIERSWSDLVVRNYMAMMWTTEGGTIQELREILRIHTSAVSLLRQALQSNSLDRVERVAQPLSERIQSLYDRSEIDLHVKLEELRAVIDNIAGRTPTLNANLDRVNSVGSDLSRLSLRRSDPSPSDVFRRPTPLVTPTRTPEMTARDLSRSPTEVSPKSGRLQSMPNVAVSQPESSRTTDGQISPSLPPWAPSMRRAVSGQVHVMTITPETPAEEPYQARSTSDDEFPRLPPSAWDSEQNAITPVPQSAITLAPLAEVKPVGIHRSTSTRSQQERFEKSVFKNSAILCDLRGQMIEFTQPGVDDDRPHDLILEECMKDCRVCLVRRRETTASGTSWFTTNIWAFNDDLTVRMQQKLPEEIDVVPYSSYFQSEKVSITIPTELIFHDDTYGNNPLRRTRTEWTNYVFEDAEAAVEFQNALYGRTLLNSFKTEKTLRVHEGLAQVIAFQEQMCAMENLRLWEEEGSAAVLGMIHFSAQFRRGYLQFYLNSQDAPVRVRDEGGKVVKIKGLKIPIQEPPQRGKSFSEGRRSSDAKKTIAGARIEFASETEKEEFLAVVKKVQTRMVENLPGLKC